MPLFLVRKLDIIYPIDDDVNLNDKYHLKAATRWGKIKILLIKGFLWDSVFEFEYKRGELISI